MKSQKPDRLGQGSNIASIGSFLIGVIALVAGFAGGFAVTHYVIDTSTFTTTVFSTTTSTVTTTVQGQGSRSVLITEAQMQWASSGYTVGYYHGFGWYYYNVTSWSTISVNLVQGNCSTGGQNNYECYISFGSSGCTPSNSNAFLCNGYTPAGACNPSCTITAVGSYEVTKQGPIIAIFGQMNDNFTLYLST